MALVSVLVAVTSTLLVVAAFVVVGRGSHRTAAALDEWMVAQMGHVMVSSRVRYVRWMENVTERLTATTNVTVKVKMILVMGA